MLRRNLLKSLSAIIPLSFLSKNVVANENTDYITDTIIKTKSGTPIRLDRSNGYWQECTYDENENRLTYEDSNGFWTKSTYDENNNKLTYETSKGYWYKNTYDQNGNKLTYKVSKGNWYEKTYNEKGQISSFKDNKEWIAYDEHGCERSRWTYNA